MDFSFILLEFHVLFGSLIILFLNCAEFFFLNSLFWVRLCLLSISGTEIFSATLSVSPFFDSLLLSVGRGRVIPAR